MGKLAFVSFCIVALLLVLGIDYSQQRQIAGGALSPGGYIGSIKQRIGAASEPAAQPETDAPADQKPAAGSPSANQLKQALSGTSTGKMVQGALGGRAAAEPNEAPKAEGQAAVEEEPKITINRPSKKKKGSGCGNGTFCSVTE
ncbi:MAG: hypothetical protein KDA37_02750 [Planctomycetales bacterium]|nr:hypothetical protein [Planctomycetales bacterium]